MKNKNKRAFTLSIVLLGVAGCSIDSTPSREIKVLPKEGAEANVTQPEELEQALSEWLDYRVQRNEVKDRESYSKGFRRGFEEPAGFVDGSTI